MPKISRSNLKRNERAKTRDAEKQIPIISHIIRKTGYRKTLKNSNAVARKIISRNTDVMHNFDKYVLSRPIAPVPELLDNTKQFQYLLENIAYTGYTLPFISVVEPFIYDYNNSTYDIVDIFPDPPQLNDIDIGKVNKVRDDLLELLHNGSNYESKITKRLKREIDALFAADTSLNPMAKREDFYFYGNLANPYFKNKSPKLKLSPESRKKYLGIANSPISLVKPDPGVYINQALAENVHETYTHREGDIPPIYFAIMTQQGHAAIAVYYGGKFFSFGLGTDEAGLSYGAGANISGNAVFMTPDPILNKEVIKSSNYKIVDIGFLKHKHLEKINDFLKVTTNSLTLTYNYNNIVTAFIDLKKKYHYYSVAPLASLVKNYVNCISFMTTVFKDSLSCSIAKVIAHPYYCKSKYTQIPNQTDFIKSVMNQLREGKIDKPMFDFLNNS